MILYDHAYDLEEALDLLPPVLRNTLDRRNTRIVVATGAQRFVEATGEPGFESLDRADVRGVVHGGYAPKANILVLRRYPAMVNAPPMPAILCHESAHVRDAAMALTGTFFSNADERIRTLYRQARESGYALSSYALVSVQEILAESARAALGFNAGPRDDRERLHAIDPELADYIIDTYLTE